MQGAPLAFQSYSGRRGLRPESSRMGSGRLGGTRAPSRVPERPRDCAGRTTADARPLNSNARSPRQRIGAIIIVIRAMPGLLSSTLSNGLACL